MSHFATVQLAPPDPIFGLVSQFNQDPNPNKVNLTVGVYFGEDGKLPLLQCVQTAEHAMMQVPKARGYLPMDGFAGYNTGVQNLVFGAASDVLKAKRVATVQAIGGTGGLKIGADFLMRYNASKKLMISDPSWENHRALFTMAGFEVSAYPYYDAAKRGIDFEGMKAALNSAEAHTVVVLHACCHNPTGYDLTPAQWQEVIGIVKARNLVAFLDMAYQGFGDGIAQDGAVVAEFVAAGLQIFVSTSFSKSFSLYGERVGALSVVCADAEECGRVMSQLKVTIRTNYSNPHTHAASVVAAVLNTPALRSQWEDELAQMRVRIKAMRTALVDGLKTAGVAADMGFITAQKGMFSYSGLTKAQMQRLRAEFGVYGTDTGRICVAALNTQNMAYVCASIAAVLKG